MYKTKIIKYVQSLSELNKIGNEFTLIDGIIDESNFPIEKDRNNFKDLFPLVALIEHNANKIYFISLNKLSFTKKEISNLYKSKFSGTILDS